MKRQEESERQGNLNNLNSVSTSTNSSNHEDSTLNDESAPLLGRNQIKNGDQVVDSLSNRRSDEATLAFILIPVIQLAAWTFVMAFQLVDNGDSVTFYTSVFALFSWVSESMRR